MRISAHKLEIETGRHASIPADERKCKQCTTDSIEDELHFIFDCTKYEPIRTEWRTLCIGESQHFDSLPKEQKIFYIFNSSEDIINAFGTYVKRGFEDRS